jgi:hypothetical protein
MFMEVADAKNVVLTYELGHEGNHEIEKTNGFDESETQNGVSEKLATEGRVAGNTVQESSEDETDTDTGTSQTDGGSAHTQVLGDLNHGLGDFRGVGTALDLEGISGSGLEQSGGLLALEGLERAGRAFIVMLVDRIHQLASLDIDIAPSLELIKPRKVFPALCLPVMVRLEAAATGARMAGRAALVAIWVARREAKTREAIVIMVVRGECWLRVGIDLRG